MALLLLNLVLARVMPFLCIPYVKFHDEIQRYMEFKSLLIMLLVLGNSFNSETWFLADAKYTS